MSAQTPMMAQYKALKAKHRDTILFFRLGDFYEMFFEDAQVASRELDIALTSRDAGKGKRAPMCGVPHHAAGDYIKVLIEKGHKVAICEQVEDPAEAKGLVRRDVVRVITPGTYWEGAEPHLPAYIAAICMSYERGISYVSEMSSGPADPGTDEDSSMASGAGLCACDVSTGEVLLAWIKLREEGPVALEPRGSRRRESDRRRLLSEAIDEISRLFPRECIVPGTPDANLMASALEKALPGVCVTVCEHFSDASALSELTMVDGVYGEGYGANLAARVPSVHALGALEGLLRYISDTQKIRLSHLKEPRLYLQEGFLEIDGATQRNLELLQRLNGSFQGSLAWVLDRCCTSIGSRLLKGWVERPLRDHVEIDRRLEAVDEFFRDSAFRAKVRGRLSRVKDLERLVTKIAYQSCDARDLVALASSLEIIPDLKTMLEGSSSPLLQRLSQELDPVFEAVRSIRQAIVEEPPLAVTGGDIIRDGFSPEVDELRELATGGQRWVLELEARERERTGIKSLKVGYNRVFGYYIEVTNANLSLVPEDYIRKQTLVSAERFITPELKDKETSILGAQERLFKEEYRIFCDIRDSLEQYTRRIQQTAAAVAGADVLASFAEVASAFNYVRPTVKPLGHGAIEIRGGRHPVLDRIMPSGTFVPNDLVLDDKERMLVITGPNMGGKSTYCRQGALILIMAQMGSFVPAKDCTVSCADKVFARVGAYDDLVLGQSTFMVEMTEVSRIIKGATRNSLVILDEIGRGTSTFDGLSVAWAVLEHLADDRTVGARGLVATHYRELTLLADIKPGIANYHVSVKKTGDEVVFLRKTVRGVAEGSFGIEVAAMAGLPPSVVERAREILVGLESEARRGARWKTGILGQVALRGGSSLDSAVIPGQASLFALQEAAATAQTAQEPETIRKVIDEIRELDLDGMTPRDALNKLFELKEKAGRMNAGREEE